MHQISTPPPCDHRLKVYCNIVTLSSTWPLSYRSVYQSWIKPLVDLLTTHTTPHSIPPPGMKSYYQVNTICSVGEKKRRVWQNKRWGCGGKTTPLNTAINQLVRENQYSPPSLAGWQHSGVIKIVTIDKSRWMKHFLPLPLILYPVSDYPSVTYT